MPAHRLCDHCGQPTTGRCEPCRRQRYGPAHQAARQHWTPLVATGNIPCHRDPTHLINPDEPWDLDHVDTGGPSQPSCAHHNRSASHGDIT